MQSTIQWFFMILISVYFGITISIEQHNGNANFKRQKRRKKNASCFKPFVNFDALQHDMHKPISYTLTSRMKNKVIHHLQNENLKRKCTYTFE